MKYKETLFVEYINKIKKSPLHDLDQIDKNFPPTLNKNMIVYGPPGVGKYSSVLYGIQKYSPTKLKYERKMKIPIDKKIYSMKISDIHYEIDIELLGCNAKIIWNKVYNNILDIISTKSHLFGIIVCKNFHKIHSELLECFYSYMQTIFYKNLNICFILITEHMCFIPYNILNISSVISLKKPAKSLYKLRLKKDGDINKITNIKDYGDDTAIDFYKAKCSRIIDLMDHYTKDNFLMEMREALYNLLICNLDIGECIWFVLHHYVDKIKNMNSILLKLGDFLKLYNNNYRPIYHLERFFLYLCSDINGL